MELDTFCMTWWEITAGIGSISVSISLQQICHHMLSWSAIKSDRNPNRIPGGANEQSTEVLVWPSYNWLLMEPLLGPHQPVGWGDRNGSNLDLGQPNRKVVPSSQEHCKWFPLLYLHVILDWHVLVTWIMIWPILSLMMPPTSYTNMYTAHEQGWD